MNADRLRAAQNPLKQKYKDDPATAHGVLRARGRVVQDDVTFVIETGHAGVPAGLHPACGGDGTKACSAEMMLEALISCAGVTLGAVSTAMGVVLDEAVVEAEGDLDWRGTLGVSRDAPVGFTAIRVAFHLTTTADEAKVKKMVELAERYCVVFQTLAKAPSLAVHVTPPRRPS